MTNPRQADLLASVSLLSDLGFALPPGESMRTAVVATLLADRLGLSVSDASEAYYTALLQHLGCIGYAHETSQVYGDETVVNAAAARMDEGDLGSLFEMFIRAPMRGRGFLHLARLTAFALTSGQAFGEDFATTRCEVGRETARRLGLPDAVGRGLARIAEPYRAADPDVTVAARIAVVAATVVRFHALGGLDLAVETVRQRAGRLLDPDVVAAFVDAAPTIVAEIGEGDPLDGYLAAEPRPVRRIAEADVVGLAAAIGDVADLKSTWTLGHSAAVARLAADAATQLGLPPATVERIRIAGHLHDVGRVAVSTAIWERPGALSFADREQVRLHPYHTERILSRSATLASLATLAGAHHERLDGSGYHRGSSGRASLGTDAQVLAAADVFAALTQDRPHRPARTAAEAAEVLEAEAGSGRLDGAAVRAVLGAAGLARPVPRSSGRPAGLSDREVEVLGLVARGLSNREIAQRLVVSPRTAEHHVQHIDAKIGVSSRAAAALFAMEHDLLER